MPQFITIALVGPHASASIVLFVAVEYIFASKLSAVRTSVTADTRAALWAAAVSISRAVVSLITIECFNQQRVRHVDERELTVI